MNKNSKLTTEYIIMIAFFVITVVYGGLCFYLYYHQSIQSLGYVPTFESDLPYHISMVVNDGWYYSLTAFIYLALYKIAGGGTVLIALFLAIVTAATVIATWKLLELIMEGERIPAMAGALAVNLVMPFFVKWAGMYRYASYQAPNVWHNSTYICMRLAAVVFLIFYVKYEKDYAKDFAKGGMNVKKWLILAVLLAVTTFIKPSFLTVFAPALFIKLLVDLIRKKASFVKVLIMGLTVVPSMGVMLWQNSILFGDEASNGYKISFMETFSFRADHPKITVILSLVFPIAVFICEVITRQFDKTYLLSIVIAFIGFVLAAFLIETGTRSRDGNFLWGYSIALFVLYLTSFAGFFRFLRQKRWIMSAVCGSIFIYQIVCGAIFFTRLISGETYFMIG